MSCNVMYDTCVAKQRVTTRYDIYDTAHPPFVKSLTSSFSNLLLRFAAIDGEDVNFRVVSFFNDFRGCTPTSPTSVWFSFVNGELVLLPADDDDIDAVPAGASPPVFPGIAPPTLGTLVAVTCEGVVFVCDVCDASRHTAARCPSSSSSNNQSQSNATACDEATSASYVCVTPSMSPSALRAEASSRRDDDVASMTRPAPYVRPNAGCAQRGARPVPRDGKNATRKINTPQFWLFGLFLGIHASFSRSGLDDAPHHRSPHTSFHNAPWRLRWLIF